MTEAQAHVMAEALRSYGWTVATASPVACLFVSCGLIVCVAGIAFMLGTDAGKAAMLKLLFGKQP